MGLMAPWGKRPAGWRDVGTVPRRAWERTDGIGEACRGQPDMQWEGKAITQAHGEDGPDA